MIGRAAIGAAHLPHDRLGDCSSTVEKADEECNGLGPSPPRRSHGRFRRASSVPGAPRDAESPAAHRRACSGREVFSSRAERAILCRFTQKRLRASARTTQGPSSVIRRCANPSATPMACRPPREAGRTCFADSGPRSSHRHCAKNRFPARRGCGPWMSSLETQQFVQVTLEDFGRAFAGVGEASQMAGRCPAALLHRPPPPPPPDESVDEIRNRPFPGSDRGASRDIGFRERVRGLFVPTSSTMAGSDCRTEIPPMSEYTTVCRSDARGRPAP